MLQDRLSQWEWGVPERSGLAAHNGLKDAYPKIKEARVMSINLTAFTPLDHGFAFENLFQTPVPVAGITLNGLCGGMTFAALDYFFAGVPIPTHHAADYPSGTPPGTPPPSSRLYQFIFSRHVSSVVSDAPRFIELGNADTGTLKVALPKEITKVIEGVNAFRPLPIGLVATGGVAGALSSHQVVGVGYDDSMAGSIAIFVYDCRYAGKLCTLTVTPASATCVLACPGRPQEMWHAFFVDQYTPVSPTYRDVQLAFGLDAMPLGIPTLKQFITSFTVSNAGDATAHPRDLSLLLDQDAGVVITPTQAPDLAPGAVAIHPDTITFPPALAGASVTVRPCFTRPHGARVVVPEGAPGTKNLVLMTVPI
jgi:hypothetical protein